MLLKLLFIYRALINNDIFDLKRKENSLYYVYIYKYPRKKRRFFAVLRRFNAFIVAVFSLFFFFFFYNIGQIMEFNAVFNFF